jgi:hypothetical protein
MEGRVEGRVGKSRGRRSRANRAKVQIGRRPVQKCKGERGRRPRDYRVQSTDYGEANKGDWLAGVWLARGKVGAGVCRALLDYEGEAKPRPYPRQCTTETLNPQPVSLIPERQLGWHAVPTLPRGSANPTRYKRRPYPIQTGGVALRGKVRSLRGCSVSSN